MARPPTRLRLGLESLVFLVMYAGLCLLGMRTLRLDWVIVAHFLPAFLAPPMAWLAYRALPLSLWPRKSRSLYTPVMSPYGVVSARHLPGTTVLRSRFRLASSGLLLMGFLLLVAAWGIRAGWFEPGIGWGFVTVLLVLYLRTVWLDGHIAQLAGLSPRRFWLAEALDLLVFMAVMLTLGALFFSHVAGVYRVPSNSMMPTLYGGNPDSPDFNGDVILVDRLAYDRENPPDRWDVAVLQHPGFREKLVKRIVGLGGERLMIAGGSVWIDGQPSPRPINLIQADLQNREPVWRWRDTASDTDFLAGWSCVTGDPEATRIPTGLQLEAPDGQAAQWLYNDTPRETRTGLRYTPPLDDLVLHMRAGCTGNLALTVTVEAVGYRYDYSLHVTPAGALLSVGYDDAGDDTPPRAWQAETRRAFPLDMTDIVFSTVDGRLWASVGNVVLNNADLPIMSLQGEANTVSVALTFTDLLRVNFMAISAPVYYFAAGNGDDWLAIPPGTVFCLGDAPQWSSDSRDWEAMRVRLPNGDTQLLPKDAALPDGGDITGFEYVPFVPYTDLIGRVVGVVGPENRRIIR